jgi:DNA-binding Xre family transcriptional regulator
MMIRAYSEMYREQAAVSFAVMMDYAINDCGLDGDTFLFMFIVTGIARHFERGNPKYIAGKSGIELAREAMENVKAGELCAEPGNREYKTPEYWAGWALACYQWYTGLSFSDILRGLPFSLILGFYSVYHEADITKFFAAATSVLKKKQAETNLKRFRRARGLSQTELAAESGASLRSIQMYEQRQKDINKAQAMTVASLARALFCNTDDLLEYIELL